MLDKEQRKDLLKAETTCASIFLRIESVLPPFLIRLPIRPSMDELESTFPPGGRQGRSRAGSANSNLPFNLSQGKLFYRNTLTLSKISI
jgi:hypothetical protein